MSRDERLSRASHTWLARIDASARNPSKAHDVQAAPPVCHSTGVLWWYKALTNAPYHVIRCSLLGRTENSLATSAPPMAAPAAKRARTEADTIAALEQDNEQLKAKIAKLQRKYAISESKRAALGQDTSGRSCCHRRPPDRCCCGTRRFRCCGHIQCRKRLLGTFDAPIASAPPAASGVPGAAPAIVPHVKQGRSRVHCKWISADGEGEGEIGMGIVLLNEGNASNPRVSLEAANSNVDVLGAPDCRLLFLCEGGQIPTAADFDRIMRQYPRLEHRKDNIGVLTKDNSSTISGHSYRKDAWKKWSGTYENMTAARAAFAEVAVMGGWGR
ncbi:hypothetical protein JKP88DRAFT_248575 [Tribonema minus]|uniref:Uncharacterized protein n=1 Tax=Tribonema minus TaxID=303371 RepID=A0A836CA31_9STRA|nr:hypothetical protein JKP88DRAFT_248575 [Tribonema minus]